MSMREGDVLGAYRIVRLVGRGGMGAVYLADDLRLGRHVALKVLGSDTADIPTVRERFVRESRLAASLDHPHILPIYEAGEADGQLFIAMRYVPGQDLDRTIASQGPLSLDRTVALIDQIASALDTAHAAGLIHRDVKPGNILLAPGSQPGRDHAYLSDFGLTKHGEQSGGLTRSGQLIGSVGYVAPEQIENRPIDARVDVYSLGCVAYECLAGSPPFPRDTDMATLYAHVNAPLPSLALARPELPPTIDAVIAKALAKSPDERFATAGELAHALSVAARPDDAARHLTRGFLFSDLRDYTAFIERNGDAAAAQLLETYRRLVRDVVRRYGGAEIKTEGDSFYVVFPSASDAVRCGLAIVDAAAAASATAPDRPIQVGIGVHAGETAETEEGYVGSAVNIAARVCAQAAAGEVLVTDTVRGLTRTSGDTVFTSRGRKHLKGIDEPMAVYAASATVPGAVPSEPAGSRRGGQSSGLSRSDRDRRRPAIVIGTIGFLGLLIAGFLVTSTQNPAIPPGTSPSSPSSPVPAAVVARSSERIVWSLEDLGAASPCASEPFGPPLSDARLWMMDPDGTNQIALLPRSDVLQRQPALGPDGRSLAFVGIEQDFSQPLWTVAPDATMAKRLDAYADPFGAASSDPSWSRDGKRITFIDAGAVVAADADGSSRVEVRQQTKPEEPAPGDSPPPMDAYRAPTWMPDGRIALVRRDASPDGVAPEGAGELYAVNADGSGYERLLGLELNSLSLDGAAWSPDGGRIVMAAQKGAAGRQIWLVNSDGTGLRQLTTEGESIAPAWSPDGSSIAFASSRDGQFEIYRMAADGSQQERLTDTAATFANCRPSWGRLDPTIGTPSAAASPAPGVSPGPVVYHRGRLEPGQHQDSTFQPAFTMTLPAGWVGRRNYIDGMAIGRDDMPDSELDVGKVQAVSPDGCPQSDFVTLGQTARDLTTWLQQHKALKTSNLRPINLGGYSGLRIDVEVRKAPKCPPLPPTRVYLFAIGQDSFSMSIEDKLTFVVLDVAGTPVTIIYGGPSDEAFKAAAQPVVDSIRFSP